MEEKYKPEVFSEKPPLDNNEINPNIPKISEIPGGVPSRPVLSSFPQGINKKNRTLQFYKFLLYSIKIEIKVHEFTNLIRFANKCEIIVWILSLILYLCTPKDFPKIVEGETAIHYKNAFIWLHIFHVVRGVIGTYIYIFLPKSYQVVEAMKGIPDDKLEKTLFNDLARETINTHALKPLQEKRVWIFVYGGLSCFNFVFDIVDFLIVLASLNKATSDAKVVLLTYLMIGGLYIVIDIAHLFWIGGLKYVFPRPYLTPIADAFTGSVMTALRRFNIGKPKTNIVEENAPNQKSNGNPQQINNNLPMVQDQILANNMNSIPAGNTGNGQGNEDYDVRIDL